MATRYLLAQVSSSTIALPVDAVREVTLAPLVTTVPTLPAHVRGVINLRGSILQTLDLRLLLGMPSLGEELWQLQKTFDQRAEDHRRWLKELADCVRERREFRLARNPHTCAFGKWHDSYKPSNDSLAFRAFWRSFDGPHQRIHQLADRVLHLSANGQGDEAMRRVEAARSGDLAGLLGLFAQAFTILHETARELIIVLQSGQEQIAVTADKVEMVTEIQEQSIESLPKALLPSSGQRLVSRVARQYQSGKVCLILDVEQLSDCRITVAA